MRRWLIPILSTAALSGLVLPTVGLAAGTRTKVKLRHTSIGNILVDSRGFTLYMFARDSRNKDTCVKLNGCTSTWPVLKAQGKPIAGPGVNASLLGTIKLSGGVRQVTYVGHPLYGYAGDSAPGETGYVGVFQFGAAWYALNAAGKPVKTHQ